MSAPSLPAQHLHMNPSSVQIRGSKPARQKNADFLEWWHLGEGVFTGQIISTVEEVGQEMASNHASGCWWLCCYSWH